MNLIEELGVNFIRERFSESLFLDVDGSPCYINAKVRWEPKTVCAVKLSGSVDEVEKKTVNIPDDFFKDLSVFGTPPLGWRMNSDGTYVVHFSKNNRMNNTGYLRGLNPRNTDKFLSPATQYLIESENLKADKLDKIETSAFMIMKPTYKSFREGLKEMRNGNIFSFVSSPVLAVIPAEDQGQAIYFNTRLAAKIDKNGELICSNPIVENYVREHMQL